MSRSTRLGIVLALAIGLQASAETAYEVILGRPTKVGETYGIVASATNTERLVATKGGEVVLEQTNATTVELEAVATVLETDEVSQPVKLQFVIGSCVIRRAGEASEPFAAGTELVVALESGTKVFTVGGEPVAADVAAALALIHSLTSSDEMNDETFGTREKRRVGDRWPVNAAHAAKWLSAMGLAVSEESVGGETVLAAVTREGDADCLRIETSLSIDDLGMPPPPGFRLEESRVGVRFSGLFPLDAGRRKVEETFEGTTSLRAVETGGDGGGAKVLMVATGERTSTAKYSVTR